MCICLPTMWFCILTEQNGCVSFIICPLGAISLFSSLPLISCSLFFYPFYKVTRRAEKRGGQREEMVRRRRRGVEREGEELQSRRNCP